MGCGASCISHKGNRNRNIAPDVYSDLPQSEPAGEKRESISPLPTPCMSVPSSLSSRRGRTTPITLGSADSQPSDEALKTPLLSLRSSKGTLMSGSTASGATPISSSRLPTPASHVPTPGSRAHPPSVSSILTTGTQEQYAEPWQTIIFFDWDDTLFPTTWLDGLGILKRKSAPTDPEIVAELEKLEKTACRLLRIALQLSTRSCIVTNAQVDWVMNSARIFMPKMAALLESSNGPRIVYAIEIRRKKTRVLGASLTDCAAWRSAVPHDEEHAAILTQAKTVAMKIEVEEFYSQYPQQSWKNVISIGDASYERDAMQEVTFMHEQPSQKKLRTKVVKLTSEPTSAKFHCQLQTIQMYLPNIVQFNEDLDVDFDDQRGEEGLAEALQIPPTPKVAQIFPNLSAMNPESRMICKKENHATAAAA